ncbi:hypothetical protein GGR34_003160 [Microvirga flocculans]|uniref:Uncharacterized protein n=1 Tax=Microvirga flocculans TaxID=217168 RepID=A0A7W6IHC6_9HYPH|nr:hypothetical protein [Microvirga flocculans]MBB4041483.1 hypothetical protein [Microvirga flocculans]
MTATNEMDAVLCQEELPDEFSRLASSSPSGDKLSVASMLSGVVPAGHPDEVTCPLLLRRHLVVPAWPHVLITAFPETRPSSVQRAPFHA